MDKLKLKAQLVFEIEKKVKEIQRQLDELRTDMHAESKSTSGDKHETGRAMIQLEMENLGKQHQNWESIYLLAKALDTNEHFSAKAGSLLRINGIWYYLSVAFGRMRFEEQDIMCLAPSAPLAQQLLGISRGSQIDFNQRKLLIEEVI